MRFLKYMLAALAALASWQATAQVTATQFSTAVAEALKTGGVADFGDQGVDFARKSIKADLPITIKGGHFKSVILDQWKNVTFDGSTFENTTNTSGGYAVVLLVNGAENVTFRNVTVRGTVSPTGSLSVVAMRFMGGKNVRVEGSTFLDMQGSLLFMRTDGATFVDNRMANIREGLNIVGATNVAVARNIIGPFHPSPGDHADGIQFFTTGLTLATDTAARGVTIENNLILSTPEGRAQGVLAGDELKLYASGRGYANITVRGNVLVGTGWHGVSFTSPTDGLVVEDNRLLRVDGADAVKSNWIKTMNGRVAGNTAAKFDLAAGTEQADNAVDPMIYTADTAAPAVANWMAKFRAPPKPMYTPVQLKVMQIEESVRNLRELVGLPR